MSAKNTKLFLLFAFIITVFAGLIFFSGCARPDGVTASKPYVYDRILRIVCIPYKQYYYEGQTCMQLATDEDVTLFEDTYSGAHE